MLKILTPPTKSQHNCPVISEEADSDDEVEDIMDESEIPEWARSMSAIREAHRKQIAVNADAVFPPPPPRTTTITLSNGQKKTTQVYDFTCNLYQIFSTSLSKHLRNQRGKPRRSSGNWARDGLTTEEIVSTNNMLGIYVSNNS